MTPFDDRKNRDTEEGEECPEERDNDPSCEELPGEFVGGAVETGEGCQLASTRDKRQGRKMRK